MSKVLVFSSVFFLAYLTSAHAQEVEKTNFRKGDFFAYWGWNRAWYTNSDIRFEGADYHFVLKDVRAQDRPTNRPGSRLRTESQCGAVSEEVPVSPWIWAHMDLKTSGILT